MKLYTFFRSGTSHRLRVALNLKGLRYEQVAVDLRREQHLTAQYKAINPQQLVPALDVDGLLLTQSPAIIEWLEERYPQPEFDQYAHPGREVLPPGVDRIHAQVDRPEGRRPEANTNGHRLPRPPDNLARPLRCHMA